MNCVSGQAWTKGRLLGALLALPLAGFGVSARADLIRASITVDNTFALYVGDYYSATSFKGSDPNTYDGGGNAAWASVETFNFDLPTSAFLYVVTASDQLVAQGFLGQFENLTTGTKFYSNDAQWQVAATGLGSGAPYAGTAGDLALLSAQIALANAGGPGHPSGGWTSLTAGASNSGSGSDHPWTSNLAGIDGAARWTWYAGGNCSTTNPTIGSCNANEWLMFRIAVAATTEDPHPVPVNVPEPATLMLLCAGFAGLAFSRRGRWVRT